MFLLSRSSPNVQRLVQAVGPTMSTIIQTRVDYDFEVSGGCRSGRLGLREPA